MQLSAVRRCATGLDGVGKLVHRLEDGGNAMCRGTRFEVLGFVGLKSSEERECLLCGHFVPGGLELVELFDEGVYARDDLR